MPLPRSAAVLWVGHRHNSRPPLLSLFLADLMYEDFPVQNANLDLVLQGYRRWRSGRQASKLWALFKLLLCRGLSSARLKVSVLGYDRYHDFKSLRMDRKFR